MGGSVEKETKLVRGVELRRDPARELCFKIVHLHSDLPEVGKMDRDARRDQLHRAYNQEVQNLEVAALCMSDFPDAPWALRLELARQCWDEARHAALYFRRFQEMGGVKGEFAIANLDWSVVGMLDSLVARLAIQHRTFEAGSLDLENQGIPMMRQAGDDATADVVEAIDADEIPHVRFANTWLKRLTDADPRAVLEVAAAIAWLRKIVVVTGDRPLKAVKTSMESRDLAGFSTAELAELGRLEQSAKAGSDAVTRRRE